MADVNELNVHDVNVKHDVDFRPATFGKPLTIVTFSVGPHGPFRLIYPQDQATSEKINGDIDHQVVELRRIMARG